MGHWKKIILIFLAFFIIVLSWEIIGIIINNPSIFPLPLNVIKTLCSDFDYQTLFIDTIASLSRVGIGFVIAVFLGISSGLLLGVFKGNIPIVFQNIIEFFRPISPIAWIPIAIIWFGIGETSSYFIIFLASFFPIFTNTFSGVTSVKQIHILTCRSLDIKRRIMIREVIVPSALPQIFAGLRIGLGFGWMAVIASEMVAAQSGLGYMIQINRLLLNTDIVIIGIITLGIIGFIMNYLLQLAGKFLMPWYKTSEYYEIRKVN